MDEEIAEVVRRFGWDAMSIADHEPPFLYSVGLMHTLAHPEFIVFGLEADNAHALFSALIADIRTGRSFVEPGTFDIEIDGRRHRVGIRTVDPTRHSEYLGFAMGFMRNIGRIGELEAVQVYWPDKDGKFPFDIGCERAVHELQPRLDIPMTPSELRRFVRRWE